MLQTGAIVFVAQVKVGRLLLYEWDEKPGSKQGKFALGAIWKVYLKCLPSWITYAQKNKQKQTKGNMKYFNIDGN